MNKTKEDFALEYACNPENIIRDLSGYPDMADTIHQAYCTGYQAAKPKWMPFNDETGKYLNTLDNPLLRFDNGQTCRYDDNHPFAIMTHFLPIPELPE